MEDNAEILVKKMEEQTLKFLNKTFVLVAVLVAGILIYLFVLIGYQQKTIDQQNTNQITVSGEGKVYAAPDIATVTLGIETKGADVKDITEKNVTAMNKIIAGIKNLGIEDKDIQTTQYSVTPQYNYTENSGTVPNGYMIDQNIEIKIRDFTKISDVFTVGTDNGANVISSLQFTIDDSEKVKSEARTKAIDQAKTKAEAMAKQVGVTLGDLVNISENSYITSPITYNSTKTLRDEVAISTTSADIQTGQQEVNLTVSLTYKIK